MHKCYIKQFFPIWRRHLDRNVCIRFKLEGLTEPQSSIPQVLMGSSVQKIKILLFRCEKSSLSSRNMLFRVVRLLLMWVAQVNWWSRFKVKISNILVEKTWNIIVQVFRRGFFMSKCESFFVNLTLKKNQKVLYAHAIGLSSLVQVQRLLLKCDKLCLAKLIIFDVGKLHTDIGCTIVHNQFHR